jgi:probable F420-dependent oxidoreductase
LPTGWATGNCGSARGSSGDAFALATAAGLATSRIPITVGPLPVSVRDPATIARAAASTAALVHRPVGVAIGTSSVRVVAQMHGRSRQHALTTMARTAQAVRTLFDEAGTAVDGETVATQGYRLSLAAPGGPITVAAFGDKAIEVAARYADRMVLDLVSPRLARDYRARLDAAAEQAGRPAPRLSAWIPAAVDPDARGLAQIGHSLVGYLTVAGYGEMFSEAGFGAAVQLAQSGATRDELFAALPQAALGDIGLIGDADAVGATLTEYADAGLDEVVLVPATEGDPSAERTLTALSRFV